MIEAKLIGDREMVVKLQAMGPALRDALVPGVRRLQYMLQGRIKQLLSGEVLRNRTGNLRNSFVPGEVEVSDQKVSGVVGSNSIYARIQDAGGTITPKNASNLTIPLDGVMTSNGVARYSAREVISNPSVGGFKSTFVAKGVIFGSNGAGSITPLFALKRSVTIPAHAYIARALSEMETSAETEIRSAMTQAAQAIQGA